MTGKFTVKPLTIAEWDDLVDLFGPERGASSGCWCLWWRVPSSRFKSMQRADRRNAFFDIVAAGPPPGLVAYDGETPAGWCAVGPRSGLPRLARSPVARPEGDTDPANTFMISCFYVRSGYRQGGLTGLLTRAAVAFARERGAVAVEACPIETGRKLVWGEGYVGIASVFRDAGFSEVARRSPTRPLMCLIL